MREIQKDRDKKKGIYGIKNKKIYGPNEKKMRKMVLEQKKVLI